MIPLNLIEAGSGFLPIENPRVLIDVRPGFTFSGKTPSFDVNIVLHHLGKFDKFYNRLS